MDLRDAGSGHNYFEVSVTVTIPRFVLYTPACDSRRRPSSVNNVLQFDTEPIPGIPDVAEDLCDLIHEILVGNSYDTLKDAVIKRTGLSEQECPNTLFENVEIGNWKSSQMFRCLK